MPQTRKNNRSRRRPKTFEIRARIEKGVENRTIRLEKLPGAGAKLGKMIESHNRHALRRMGRICSEEVVEPPHSMCQLRRRQDPATAQTAQAVALGQAAGHDKIFA